MKKIIATALAVSLYMSILGISTITDGDWHDPANWSSGAIPTAADDVTVGHLITLAGTAECHNLTMQGADSMVRNHDLVNSTLSIYGDLLSTGWLASNNSSGRYLTVNLYGNLNSYYNFSPGTFNIMGSGNRTFELGTDSYLAPHVAINVAATIDTIFAAGPINISNSNASGNTTVNGQGDDFYICLSEPDTRIAHPMRLTNCTVQHGVIVGTGTNSLTWSNTRSGYATNLRIARVDLYSPDMLLVSSEVVLQEVTNNAAIYNYLSNNQILTLEGDFVNNGNIRSNPSGYNLNIYCYGNIDNNGWFAPANLYMQGSGERSLAHSAGNPFRVVGSIIFDAGITLVRALSDLQFVETDQISGGYFDLSNSSRDGWDLSIEGGAISTGSIIGGSGSEFTGINTALASMALSNVTLSPASILNFRSGCSLTDCPNYGVIQNSTTLYYDLYIYNNFVNYGTVRNNPNGYYIRIYADSDITNNGTWINNLLNLNGTTLQTISFPSSNPLKTTSFIYSGSGGGVILAAGQDFVAENCMLDLDNDALYLPTGNYGIVTINCNLIDANVQSTISNFLNMTGGYISGCSFLSFTNNGTLSLNTTTVTGSLINNGTIQNYTSNTHNLTVTQDLTNNGIIRNNPGAYDLKTYISGNVVNNGIWSNHSIYLNGADVQYISFPLDHAYTGINMLRTISTQPIIPATDLYLSNCIADLGTAPLDLVSEGNRSLYFNNSSLKRAQVLSCTASILSMQNGGIVENCSFQSITFEGVISISTDTNISGTLINNGILQNYTNYRFNIYISELYNNGTIRDNPGSYDLYPRISGDIHNPGTIECDVMYLTGSYCYLDNPGTIDTRYLYMSANPSELVLGNNMSFSNTRIDFTSTGRGIIRLNDLRNPITLTMVGGVIADIDFIGGPGATIFGLDPCFMQNCSADELTIEGTVWVDNVAIDKLTNNGTIQNYHNYFQDLTITERLDNYGTISNNTSYSLDLNLEGDLYDYGVISIRAIYFTADVDQHIYQDAAADTLRVPTLTKNTSGGDVIMLSDLRCLNTVINFYGNHLQMYDGRNSYALSLKGGYITGTYLETSGFSELWMGGNAYLSSISGGDIIFGGTIQIHNTCSFGSAINNGTIMNYTAYNASLVLSGDFTNYGVVSNSYQYILSLYLGADFQNSGTISNQNVYINGNGAQDIIIGGMLSPTHCYLVSDVGSAAWYHNGFFSGGSGSQIDIDISSSANLGQWQAYNVSSNSWGRIINIQGGQAPSTPQGLCIAQDGTNLVLQWNQALYASSYRLYASDQPLGGFVLIEDNIIDPNTGDGIVEYCLPATENRSFFRVSSRN